MHDPVERKVYHRRLRQAERRETVYKCYEPARLGHEGRWGAVKRLRCLFESLGSARDLGRRLDG